MDIIQTPPAPWWDNPIMIFISIFQFFYPLILVVLNIITVIYVIKAYKILKKLTRSDLFDCKKE